MEDRVERSAEVPAELHGARLDQAAAQLFPEFSRARLQAWIRSADLLKDQRPCRPRDKVEEGAVLSLHAALQEAVTWAPQDMELNILYEDDAMIILDKPAGLVVHPAAGHADGTLVNALLAHAHELARLPRAGIVHRLDRDTTGVMVVARTLQAHHHLVAQLQARQVKREYLAVCIGAMTGGGSVDEPIGRHPKQRKKMAVVATGGKSAITHYRVERRFAHHTQIGVSLETGRTHQIRVHMAHRHHPLVGDPAYGGRPRIPAAATPQLIEALRSFPRQALHARALGLSHPDSGEMLQFDCPVPDDLCNLLSVLQREDAVESNPHRT
ncbi:MAG: 23S rRNA pseudouridine(1911/1915/1917) synthase RluD [Pseudomonadota bacterium]